MAVRIRLQRHGRKARPFYWVVVADSRVKRDGRFLDKLGTYDPTTNPAQIELNVDNTVKWLKNGAQPSDTARRILSYKGALLKWHLSIGIDKGAITQEQADSKFEAWSLEKSTKIKDKKQEISKSKEKETTKRLEEEKKISENRVKIVEESEVAKEEEVSGPPTQNTEVVEAKKESVPKKAEADSTPKGSDTIEKKSEDIS
ncbi:30S ribosomal protein S16 [Elysia marginata]|uniref:Small ribosomal subunit protein bS16m n=1 Tax=Elysia marginata TaxID=1093978 RepID=A0AAV4FH10_9GAST|nr:30S ribosomal protein S16 [Elysia marginata]